MIGGNINYWTILGTVFRIKLTKEGYEANTIEQPKDIIKADTQQELREQIELALEL